MTKKTLLQKQPKAFDPQKWIDLAKQFGAFLPIIITYAQTILDAFKKKANKAAADFGHDDCCPFAAECVAEMKAALEAKLAVVSRMESDPCSEDLCKEYQQASAEEFAAFLRLHACHE